MPRRKGRTRRGGADRPRTGKAQGGPRISSAQAWLFGGGLLCVIVGFVLLAQGSITAAPILLVLGYCVLIPVAIVYRPRSDTPAGRSR